MIVMSRVLSLVLLFLAVSVSTYAVDNDSSMIVLQPRFTYSPYVGQLLGRDPEVARLRETPYLGQELLLGYQTSGNDPRNLSLNNPYYGLGLYYGAFGDDAIEDVFATFVFLDIPVWQGQKSSLNIAAAMGLALNCSQYSFDDDPSFLENSSYANVYSHISLSYHYWVSPRLDLGLGARFQHFSNGGWQYPNHGMEMASVQLSVSYLPLMDDVSKASLPKFEKKHEFITVLSVGVNGSETNYDKKFFNSTLSSAYSVIRKPCYALSGGVDITYNGSLSEMESPSSSAVADLIYGGVFISNELIYQKTRLGVQVGTYLFGDPNFESSIYERLVLRYQFVPKSFLHFGIKLNGDKSECLEWGIGFVI